MSINQIIFMVDLYSTCTTSMMARRNYCTIHVFTSIFRGLQGAHEARRTRTSHEVCVVKG